MNATVKTILVVSAKNAVNAILTNGALMTLFSGTFHLHSWAGALNVLKATGAVIGIREAQIWVPKLLKWSTDAEPPATPPSTSSKYTV